jgi:hypothetical protein
MHHQYLLIEILAHLMKLLLYTILVVYLLNAELPIKRKYF